MLCLLSYHVGLSLSVSFVLLTCFWGALSSGPLLCTNAHLPWCGGFQPPSLAPDLWSLYPQSCPASTVRPVKMNPPPHPPQLPLTLSVWSEWLGAVVVVAMEQQISHLSSSTLMDLQTVNRKNMLPTEIRTHVPPVMVAVLMLKRSGCSYLWWWFIYALLLFSHAGLYPVKPV